MTHITEEQTVEKQKGSSDCGLFAVVFATSLCIGLEPANLKYHQESLQSNASV